MPPKADAPSVGRPPAAAPPLRSEGQRLLLAVSGSLASIAQRVGAGSKQSVADWRAGRQVPSAETRAKLYAAYAIPIAAWGSPPGSVVLPPATETQPSSAPVDLDSASAPTTMADCMGLLKAVQDSRKANGLTPAEKVKLADTEARILALKHRLEREAEMVEDRIVRQHPTWQRMKKSIVRALVGFPDAALAVAAVLEELEGAA